MHKLNVELLIEALDNLMLVMSKESENPDYSWEDLISFQVNNLIDDDSYEQIWEHFRNDYR